MGSKGALSCLSQAAAQPLFEQLDRDVVVRLPQEMEDASRVQSSSFGWPESYIHRSMNLWGSK